MPERLLRGVALDDERGGAAVAPAAGHGEAAGCLARLDAEGAHHGERHVDVGAGLERRGEADFRRAGQERQREEEAGDELRGDVAGQFEGAGTEAARDGEREEAAGLGREGEVRAGAREGVGVGLHRAQRQASAPGEHGGAAEGGRDGDEQA